MNIFFQDLLLRENNKSGGSAPPPPTLLSITVTPANPSLDAATQQMTATGNYSDSSTADLTATVTWDSVTPAKATVSAGGLVTPLKAGTSSITATLGLVVGSTTATVNPVVLTHVGSVGAAATSVAIPAHVDGDLVIVTCRRGNTTPPSIPAAGGTVPTWLTVESAGADALSLMTVYAVSNGSATTGTFTNAAQIAVSVWRGNRPITLAAHSTKNEAALLGVTFPALVRTLLGTPTIVRTTTRAAASAEIGTAPTNYVNRVTQPSGASASLALHSRDAVAADPVEDTVVMSVSAAYRAHSMEIGEAA